ncbi:MAG: HEAT repeat domain-containing protein [Planctomycetota bacterium]|jgi:HEAT repeat protein
MFKLRISVLLLAGLFLAEGVQSSWGAAKGREAKLIGVLESDASFKEKSDACRELGMIGTKDSIAVLAKFLGDEKLSHMARYGLEPNPDPAVDEVFRDALGKLKGRSLVGVIGSIGVRRDAKAVKVLAKKLRDSDLEVAQAAARALGSIGGQEAAGALQGALANAAAANKAALYEGLFRCAENFVEQDNRFRAVGIYDNLLKVKGPHQVRSGALRGAILARGKQGLGLLRESLYVDDYIMFSAAVQTSMEMPGSEVTEVLASALKDLPTDNQILVIQALGKRGDATALPVLFAAMGRVDKSILIAAIRLLPEMEGESALPWLGLLLGDGDGEYDDAVQEALGAIPGKEVDTKVMSMLTGKNAKMRLVAIELMGRRRMVGSIGALLKVAGEEDSQVRPAAIKMVGELGGPDQLPVLLNMLKDLNSAEDLAAVEQALGAVCAKSDKPESHSGELIKRMAQCNSAQKGVLLRVLGGIGGAEALEVVSRTAEDFDSEVGAAAVTVLCRWKTAEAAPGLLALAVRIPDGTQRTAVLRGYISLVRGEGLSVEHRVAMCKHANVLIRRDQEKKLLLSVLGTVPSVEALSMAMGHIDNAAVKNEAALATVAISEKIVEQKPAEVLDAMQKVIQATDNEDVKKRAKGILEKAKK